MALSPDETTIGDDVPVARRRTGPHVPLPQAPTPSEEARGETENKVAGNFAEEDPRTRAARRTAELLEHQGDLDQGIDDFYIDPRIIPEGWSYEWKRHTILNQEDPSYQVQLAQGGWEAVPAYRHPQLMPTNYSGNTILRKGMLLMERPLEITARARARDLFNARDQVRMKEAQLTGQPAGPNSPFSADNKGAPLVKINKSYEPMPIPEK
jgi:hypothetical protein